MSALLCSHQHTPSLPSSSATGYIGRVYSFVPRQLASDRSSLSADELGEVLSHIEARKNRSLNECLCELTQLLSEISTTTCESPEDLTRSFLNILRTVAK